MRVHSLTIKDFRCISSAEVDMPAAGTVVSGPNGRGKTSVLLTLQVALTGRGVSADAIKLGSDRAEIRVDLGDTTVRRVICRDSAPRLSVKRDGVEVAKPAAHLAKAAEREAEAARLDAIVVALRDDAPSAILSESHAIPGLRLVGDDIYLDGVNVAARSGAEQLRFAVEIAKRAAKGEARLLVVDGLERLDPASTATFLREATSGGWQVIASRVGPGESVQFEAIEGEV